MRRKQFCEMGPVCYSISLQKEIARRHLTDWFARERFATEQCQEHLPHLAKGHRSLLLRHLAGVDMQLQHNKITNLRLSCAHIDGLLIRSGETFSFWQCVGRVKASMGYLEGMALSRGGSTRAIGGGICQLANIIHWLVLHSPLTVTELHHHTDALFPDDRRTVPFGTGTSVFYNNVDYRFKNNTGQTVQILVWLDETHLCGELRAQKPFPLRYRLVEEDHHFACGPNGLYYRNSLVYRLIWDSTTGAFVEKQLVLRNHSEVLYDSALIPPDEIREEGGHAYNEVS